MTKVGELENFSARVNTACNYIANNRRESRTFDTCFEMYDGSAVALAVYRRSRKNPRIRRNIWKYLGRKSVLTTAFAERRRPTRDIARWAAELREKALAEQQDQT